MSDSVSKEQKKMLRHRWMPHLTSEEVVVLVHGLGGSSSIWFKQIKEYRKHFNLLIIDMPGHGGNDIGLKDEEVSSFVTVAKSVSKVLDHYHIRTAHFVGISLGTIVIQVIQDLAPDRVKSMVLGGAVEGIYEPLLVLARLLGSIRLILPYMWLYRLCAWVLMPMDHHKEARKAFVVEAAKLGHEEFFCWYRLLCNEVNDFFAKPKMFLKTPTQYLMGSEDYMFLPLVKKSHLAWENVDLYIIQRCGHVCNIEREKEFNHKSIAFIQSQSVQYPSQKQA